MPDRCCDAIVAANYAQLSRIRTCPGHLKPIISAGTKYAVIDRRLEVTNPEAFEFLMSFARGNELQIREGRHEVRRAVDLDAQAA